MAEELPDLPELVSGGVQAAQPQAWPCIPSFSKYLLATKQKQHRDFFPSKQTAFWRGHFFHSAGDKGEPDRLQSQCFYHLFLPLHYTPWLYYVGAGNKTDKSLCSWSLPSHGGTDHNQDELVKYILCGIVYQEENLSGERR